MPTDLTDEQEKAVERALRTMATLFYSRSAGCSLRRDEWTAILRALVREVVGPVERERNEARRFGEDAAARYNDLLAEGRILRCAFCSAEYPPDTPPTQHEALTAHVLVCPAHPMRAAESALSASEKAGEALAEALEMAIRIRMGAFATGWTLQVTGHQMNAICEALYDWSQRKPTSAPQTK